MGIGRSPTKTRIAIIGAGMAGLTCARQLAKEGFRPTVFEKSRGLGGRLATRRMSDGTTFDHGAQYVTARSAAFRRALLAAEEAGRAAPWHPDQAEGSDPTRGDWFVGTPAMNALVKPLSAGMDIRLSTEVDTVRRDGTAWQVAGPALDAGERFDVVVCTAPAPQARRLLASEPEAAAALAGVAIAPCWALMLRFAGPVDPGFEVRRSASGDLAWIARNGSKPGRDPGKECWVVHAGPDWSRRHLELERDRVAAMMAEMLPRAFAVRLPEIEAAVAHRWRYARTTAPLGEPFFSLAQRRLFLGGDWCLGARVECAFQSGQAIAQAVVDASAGP
ncbi:MAG: FAD-dependent oxidoreductase [Kiloniellales bacterium]|nr:FAD-dependent oxidoreductase [Kiloniellales bacterium]